MSDIHACDHIDLPAIRPAVARTNRHRGACPSCRTPVSAPAPEGFEPRSPSGPGIAAPIIHLRIAQAASFERLARLMGEVFGPSIGEGAIADIPARAQAPLLAAATTIAAAMRASPVVGSDETSARVRGSTWRQWALLGSTATCHVIADTRAASVVAASLQGARPEAWVADRCGGQLGHGAVRQMCLAHLLRDAAWSVEAGDAVFAPGCKRLPLRAMAIGRRRPALAGSPPARFGADQGRRLDELSPGPEPKQQPARRLFQAMRRNWADLSRSVTRRDAPCTNDARERALRPSATFRDVTNRFRAEWGAKLHAAAAGVIATGRLHGRTALQALHDALASVPVMRSG